MLDFAKAKLIPDGDFTRRLLPEQKLLLAILVRSMMDYELWSDIIEENEIRVEQGLPLTSKAKRNHLSYYKGRRQQLREWFSEPNSDSFGSFGNICAELNLPQKRIYDYVFERRKANPYMGKVRIGFRT